MAKRFRADIVAWLLGLATFLGSPWAVQVSAEGIQIGFNWAITFTFVAALAYGVRGTLIAGFLGLGGLHHFLLWPANGYANLAGTCLILGTLLCHGCVAETHAVRPRWWTRPLTIQAPLGAAYALGVYLLFPPLLAMNPAPWCSDCSASMSNAVRLAIGGKTFIMLYANLAVASVLLMTGPPRRLLGLVERPHGRLHGRILAVCVVTATVLWGASLVLAGIYGAKQLALPLVHRELTATELMTGFVLFFGSIVVAQVLMTQAERLAQRVTQLQASESKLRGVLDSLAEALFLLDPSTGKVRQFNRKAAKLFGDESETALRSAFAGLVVPDTFDPRSEVPSSNERPELVPERLAEGLREIAAQPGGGRAWTARSRDGVAIPVVGAVTRTPLEATDDVLICTLSDVSEQRRAELELEQSRRLDAVGRLASGVAHDFNNMLTAIRGAADLLAHDLPQEPEARENLETIVIATDRAEELTRQLLHLTRKTDDSRQRPFAVHLAIQETINMLRRTSARALELETDLQATEPYVLGNHAQFQSALLNLGVNAVHAMPTGGRLIFRTRAHTDALGSERVRVEVEDNGAGIATSDLPHVFEPFYTTKADAGGSGLGLAAVFGTVRVMGGTVNVDSELDRGTRIIIDLPFSKTTRVCGDLHESSGGPASGRVLLVDDEAMVRRVTARLLRHLGYEALEAADGASALEMLRDGAAIDVVLLDSVMPAMSGRACFRLMRKAHPQLPIVMCSGYTREGDVAEMLDEGFAGFVRKPASAEVLRDAIERARTRAEPSDQSGTAS